MNATLLSTVAAITLLPPIHVDARALDIFMGLHWCHCNVSAVHLDGNTSLFTPQAWLPNTTSSPRFMRAWWEKGVLNANTAKDSEWVVWSVNDQYSDFVDIVEGSDLNGYDFVQIDFQPFIGGQRSRYGYYCRTTTGVIPRGQDAPWTFIMVRLDLDTKECDYFVQYGGHKEGGTMSLNAQPPQGSFPWDSATGWWIAGNITMVQQPANMDTAEAYLDLSTQYNHDAFVNGTTSFQFVSPGGNARNLDDVYLLPPTRNCAGPIAKIPEGMCNRGGAVTYPLGQEAAPGIDAYNMTVIGTLTTAPTDPCWIPSPTGDGCGGL